MIDNNTTEKKYISQVVLPPIEQGGNERLYLIKDKNARDNIETLQSNLTSLNEEINTLDTKVDNLDIPDISNLVTTDNLNNKISNLITKNELDNTYVKWSALASNYSNNSVLNNNYAHTTNGIIDNATVDYTDVNNLYNNYAHTNANGTIDNALIDYTSINNLYNNYAHINNGEIDNATIDHSNINNLNTNYAHINNGTIDNANIDYANINNLENNYAHINNGIIDNATINYTDVNNLNANYAHINNGKIDNATIDQSKINNLKSNYAHITNGAIDNATINYAKIDDLDANYAHVTNGIIDNASINHANINGLESNYAHIINGTINNATIDYANVNNLENNYAHIREGIIDNAIINYANVSGLNANYAHLTDGVIDNAFIDHANVNELETYYAEIDMANVNNAWIENGVIKDGVIEDAKIAGVSANKITAGTIDAANVNVINLRADNLTVTKINGQPVIGGYTLVDSSISNYSEKNPSNEGWYELYDNAYHPTNDTIIDSNKNYYTTSESVSLYDQNTIDSMFNNINERIDSQIETWTVDAVPLLTNEPAVNWTTDDEKNEHIGDICYVVNAASDYDGFTYRFAYDNTSHQYSWVLIQDNQVTAALGRITNLESFNNQLVHWEDATDEGVIAVRGRITELSGRIDNALPASTFTNFQQNTFREVQDTVNGWKTTITQLQTSTEKALSQGVEYIIGTHGTTATNIWTGVTQDEQLHTGKQIAFYMTSAGTTNAATLNLTLNNGNGNTTGAKNIKINDTNVTNEYPANTIIKLTYDGVSWKSDNYNSDTNYYDREAYKANVTANEPIAAGKIGVFGLDGKLKLLSGSIESQTSAQVGKATVGNAILMQDEASFDISYPILYIGTSYTTNNLTQNDNYTFWGTPFNLTNTHSISGAVAGKPVYIVGTLDGNIMIPTSNVLTCTIPTEEDNLFYIRLGLMSSETDAVLESQHPIYTFINGTFQQTTKSTVVTSNMVNSVSQTANSNSAKISNLVTTLGTNVDGTTSTHDIVHQVSEINQNLDGITTRVSKTEASLKGTYAISSTAANVQNKQATIFPSVTNFELYEGMAITVKFINNNTVTEPKLNINSSEAKFIKTYSGVALNEAEYEWDAGTTMTFVYDGTYWRIQDSTELTRIKSAETIIDQTANNVLIKATENDSTAAQGGQHIIQSLINVAPSGITIDADKVNIEGAAIFSSGRLSQNSLNAAQQAVIETAAQDATDKVNAVNNQEQLIYIQAVDGTLSIPNNALPTTWVSNTGESVSSDEAELTPEWTTKRPTYRSNYPILFVATQRQTVGGTITCSTPLKDDTLTIIDGGHITTGTIDARQVTVNNIHAENITVGTINGNQITNGAINFDKLDSGVKNNINTISNAATTALNNLATIENVVDTLTWVTEHGTMVPTTDTTIDATKVYFILDNNGDYTVRNNKYSIVQEPNISNLSNYYELTIDKSIQNYIATHLSLTNEGLWLIPMATESTGCKVLVATGGSEKNYPEAGTYIIDRDNNGIETVIAQFTGTGISFAEDRSFHIGDASAFIHFGRDDNGIGHINIGGSQVTIGGNTTLQQLLNKYNSTITSDDISVSKSGNTATITIGNDSVNIVDGAAGEDGAQILGITTAPSSYTTTTNGFTPTYRIALSTVKTQSGASEVKIGDILAYSYYHYPVGYVDASYVYCGVRKSIRGETGAAGHSPVITTTKNNDGSVTINVDGTPMSTVDAGEDGDTPVITTTKGSDGSVTIYIDGVLSNTVEAGANGTSYYTYIRYSANADGNNMVITPTATTKYIGIYTGTSSSVPSYTDFEWSKYIGENGNDADPLTITSTAVDYQLSTSGTTEPTGTWSEMPLAPTTTQYLWTRTTLTFSDNTTITSYSVGGKTGQDGATGGRWYAGTGIAGVNTAGKIFLGSGIASAVVGDMYLNTSSQNTYRCIIAGAPSVAKWIYVSNIKGNSVTDVEHQYYLSTSSIIAPLENDNNWKATPDPYVEGHYYWERWKIVFSAANIQYTTPTLAEEITSAWAAIEKSNEEINLRATKTEMYQTAQPNLAPIGSVDFSNIYNINTNPNGYWRTALNGINTWFTQLDDGWIHVYIDNSEGIEDINNLDFSPDLCPSIIPGNPYTILTEIRNNSSLGTDENNTNFYLDEVNNNQFWGNVQNEQIDNEYMTTSTNIELLTCGQTNTLYSYRLADTSHIADINEAIVGEGIVGRAVIVDNNSATQNNDNNNSLPSLFCYNFQCAAGSILDFDFRMSVYEGIYNGPYKPYSGPQLYSSQAELKVQADRIGMIVANDNAESNLQLTADAMTYIGDHVEIKGIDGTSTVIRGGQIQTGSLSIGAFDSAAQSATLNSNINVGGRNWLLDTETFKGWPRSIGIPLSNGVATFSSRSSLSWAFIKRLTIPAADFFGNTWTFSFDYRSDDFSDTSGNQYIDVSLEGGAAYNTSNRTKYRELNHSSISGAANTWVPTTEWQRGSATFTATDESFLNSGSGDVSYVGIDIRSYTLNSFQVRHIKLEKGNIATDWTLAPEDVDADISDAAKTATSYVTDIDNNGITIHPSRSDYETNGGRAVINSDGLTVYVNNNDVASYGTTARIGKSNSDRVTIDSTNGITIYKSNQSNQGIKKLQTTANGIDIYGDDGITNIASFGETTRIGRSSQGHAEISENGFNYSQGNENIFTVEAYGEQIYELGIEYGNRVTIPAGGNARVSGTYDSQLVLEKPKCVYQLETGLWKEIDYSSDGEESIYYNGISSSITADSSIETWGFSVYNNTSSSITAVIAQVFDRRSVSTRIGKINSDRVTVDPTNGITIYKGNNKKLQTTTNGIEVYQDSTTRVASFGSTTRIGADNNVQVIIESGAMSIENENDEELFKVEANRSGTTTETTTANDVAVWNGINDVTTVTHHITDTTVASGTATAIVTVDNTRYELDSSQATTAVTVGSEVTVTLTDNGVSYVQELMTIIEEDDEGVEIATYQQCSLSVTYFHTIADSAILTMDGRQVINGVRSVLTLNNEQWSSNNQTDTLMLAKTKGPNNKTYGVAFGVGSGGVNRGVYDSTKGNWIIYRNSSDQTVINGSKMPTIINGTNFSVAANGDTTVRLLRTAGSIGTYNQTNSGRLRPASGTANLLSFTSYDNLKKSIGYSNIIATSNRIYRSFTVTNLKTNKTAGIYVNNYDNGNMSLSYTDGMTLHATSVDPLSAITTSISGQTDKTIPASTTDTVNYTNLNLAATTTVGSDFSISGSGVKCSRAGKIMVSAAAKFKNIGSGNVCNVKLKLGSTEIAFASNRGTSDRCQLTIPPRITTVSAGDVIYMSVANSTPNSTGTIEGSKTQTWMTVQYLT